MWCVREREKKIFCNGTCAVAAGKNLGELIEFNLVQQASCSWLEFFFFFFGILMIKNGLITLRELTRI